MAQNSAFDVSTVVDLQEVDNAVNQATKEIQQRYDFKGTKCTLELDRKEGAIKLDADDEYKVKAVLQVLREKLSKRGVPLKNLDEGTVELGSMGRGAAADRSQAGDRPGDREEDLEEGPGPGLQKGPGADPGG